MNIVEKIGLMKAEIRLANRAKAEGLKNWTPEARAASLATRRAKGSVWGWDKRKRAIASTGVTEGFDRTMDALEEDAPKIARQMEIYRSGGTTIGPRNKYADEVAAERLESFKKWLAEVKRVEGAIDQFNGTVAALGGLTGGMAKAQRGQTIGPVKQDAAAEAATKKISLEKSLRRNFEKRNADHLRKYPEERDVMLDMVAEKAEYYSAQPARKVEMEKAAYRQIRDEGATQMREKPIVTGASSSQTRESPQTESMIYKTLLEDKRAFVRERESIKSQLVDGEIAYPVGKGRWVAQMHDGTERVISTDTKPNTLGQKPSQVINDDLLDAINEARLGARRGSGLIVNRHTSACASSKGEKCDCSCGGAQHGSQSSGDGTAEPPKTDVPKVDKEASPPAQEPEEAPNWEALVAGFKAAIEKGMKPTMRELKEQLAKDGDEAKFKLDSAALAEAWHTTSLDKFQDQFGRDPKRNFEFRTFQKKIGVPPEFIGGK